MASEPTILQYPREKQKTKSSRLSATHSLAVREKLLISTPKRIRAWFTDRWTGYTDAGHLVLGPSCQGLPQHETLLWTEPSGQLHNLFNLDPKACGPCEGTEGGTVTEKAIRRSVSKRSRWC